MSDDWKPGDVAVCVDDEGNPTRFPSWVKCGRRYTVMAVVGLAPKCPGFPVISRRLHCSTALVLLEVKHPNPAGVGQWSALRFKKEPPLITEDEVRREAELDVKKPATINAD